MKLQSLVYISLFAALTAALGIFPPIQVPALSVPITAQSLGIMLAGGILGARKGGKSLLLFLILVAIGLPLLAGGRGGLGVVLGPSGGFLLTWPIGAFITGLLIEKFWSDLNVIKAFIAAVIGGIAVIYIGGILWLAVNVGLGLEKAFYGSIAYIPGDLVKAVIAAFVIVNIKKYYPIIKK